jgi:hypothetical protein
MEDEQIVQLMRSLDYTSESLDNKIKQLQVLGKKLLELSKKFRGCDDINNAIEIDLAATEINQIAINLIPDRETAFNLFLMTSQERFKDKFNKKAD